MTTPSTSITQDLLILCSSIEERRTVVDRLLALGLKAYHEPTYTSARAIERASLSCWDVNTINVTVAHTERRFDSTPYGTGYGKHAIPASLFLTDYPAPGGAASVDTNPMGHSGEQRTCVGSQPSSPVNPPNFIVDTGGNATLSRIVQELCFAADLPWQSVTDGTDRLIRVADVGQLPLLNVHRHPDRGERAGFTRSTQSYYPGYPVYSAATQMGEIVRLLSTPVVPPKPPAPVGPSIHGHTGVYREGDHYVTFGCAHLCTGLLQRVLALNEAGITGNRTVASVTLAPSGKTLTLSQIKEVLAYVKAVDAYQS